MDSRLSGPDTSLSAPVSSEDETGAARMDFLVDDRPLQDEVVEGMIDDKRRSEWLQDALEILNDREKRIIVRRRLTEDGATLETLGTELGISKERVRQIENRALEKLRGALVSGNPDMAAMHA
jgi:RNA polymerase sigma-32 factor